MTQKKQLNKIEAIDLLKKLDHGFLTEETAIRISEPFGFTPTIETQENHPEQVKGLDVPGAEIGEKISGKDAANLSEELCNHLNLKYPTLYGKGSRLRMCCDIMKKHLVMPKTFGNADMKPSKMKMNRDEIIDELIEISKRIDHFMGKTNHNASFYDDKAIQDWNNGNFGIYPLIDKMGVIDDG